MLIDKYVLCMPTGMKKVAKRMDIPRTPTLNDMAILYAIKKSPSNSFSGILRYIHARRTMDDRTLKDSLLFMLESELIKKENKQYYLTSKGLEYLASVRRYLLNIRF